MTNLSDTLAALKPCPFCGSGAKIVAPLGFGNVRAVECGNVDCVATGPWAANEAEAIAAWDTRTGQLVPVPSVERVARVIASAMGDNYSDAFKNKDRWIAKRGMSGGRFRDVNEPMQCDYDAAATAAIAAMQEGRDG